jgi:hypothetical protein
MTSRISGFRLARLESWKRCGCSGCCRERLFSQGRLGSVQGLFRVLNGACRRDRVPGYRTYRWMPPLLSGRLLCAAKSSRLGAKTKTPADIFCNMCTAIGQKKAQDEPVEKAEVLLGRRDRTIIHVLNQDANEIETSLSTARPNRLATPLESSSRLRLPLLLDANNPGAGR